MTKEMIVFFTAMMPISELRGAIPLGINLGMEPMNSFILSVIGNLIIVPILLLIVRPIFTYFKTLKRVRDWINKYEERAAGKVKNYRKFRLLGLFLLVAVPVPTTGVYTGVVAANVLQIRFKNAWLAISLGVISAGVIVYMISLNIIHLL
ncbi:MAG: small multi-drug export protein [Bacillota bacterium]|nr:small multi-drug export protein [Bacillota bacterium]